ncbi:hypothetical protein EJ05DRAFT_185871 [Pseudovirgaria hyperparasitica]|uniref:SUZ-C domain-containing protein n=1 Tax=Pseudovirgaria hyperparasitica TaxID=470096 RepID=A0A6A6WJW5_9PEZI|nr:uncharacterized protein EJ05DRAFT_185871 [Pseudovirgaria hyperparasitica]KAF2761821.1 hypothetical protein EJ05DRAFT_185871 [Pseudovirgaria hyperparasitica]
MSAWDDDWVKIADREPAKDTQPEKPKKLTKAERRAQHAQLQRELWDTADNPAPAPIFVTARDNTPVQGDPFRAPMKLLSRKPPPKVLSKTDVEGQIGGLSLDDDDDSEEEERKRADILLKERQANAAKDREEKKRAYAERRAELGVGASVETQGRASPQARYQSQNQNQRGKGKGKGGQRSGNVTPSSGDHSPARGGPQKSSQLFEPGYAPKPNSVYIQRRAGEGSQSNSELPKESQILRAPRGPDGSGRGGFGFAPRGNKSTGSV